MFRFAVHVRDATYARYYSELGIVEDEAVSRQRFEAFFHKYPDFRPYANEQWTQADREYEEIADGVVFLWDGKTPQNLGEAVDLVTSTLFLPPTHVWLAGEEYPVLPGVSA
ncbi:MAG: hypothetical protein M0T84_04390 [Betaproteobacteria bacterium]|nr:hypothetical protein [Betaproteobacteria bacterium]